MPLNKPKTSSSKSASEDREPNRNLDLKILWGIYWLKKANFSYAKIGDMVGVASTSVQRVVNRIKNTGSPMQNKSSGRPKVLSERDLNHLELIVRRYPFASYNQMISELKSIQVNIHKDTLISYLKDMGFTSYFAAHKPELSEVNRLKRLRWAKERVNWPLESWRRVVWSDESRFTVESYRGGARVLRKLDKRYQEQHVVPTTKWGKGGVMIWGCFWAGGFGPLVLCDSSVNQDAYVNILGKNLMPWFFELSEKEDQDFILQEDHTTCRTGKYVTWWKDTHQTTRFDFWPPQSPDLNPMEHIWSSLDKLIEEKRPDVNNVEQLESALKEAWAQISVDLATRLVESMKDRCQAVIDANGGPTKY